MPERSTTDLHAERHRRSAFVQKRLDLPAHLDRAFLEWIYRVKLEEDRTVSQAAVLRGLVQLLITDDEVERRLRQHLGLPVGDASDADAPRRPAGLPAPLD